MALYEIKAKYVGSSFFFPLEESWTWHLEAESEDEVMAFLEKRSTLAAENYEITKIIREPVATVTRDELRTRRQKAAEEKAKADRKALYQKLKAEFEATSA